MDVLGSLCHKDKRNPLYFDIYALEIEAHEPTPEPRKDCACDNCFYGLDELATEILKLRDKITEGE